MTKTEALEFINNSNKEFKEKLDAKIQTLRAAIEKGDLKEVKLDVRTFESLLTDVIRYKWARQYPGTFLTCHITGEEYSRVCKAPYSYYMKTINGDLKEFESMYELDDQHLYSNGGYTDENRLRMYDKRLRVVDEILNNREIDNIAWCVDNVCI